MTQLLPGSPLFMFLAGLATIASLGELAVATGMPWIFPSLGPTAVIFFLRPRLEAARPRNVLCGHAIGILCGWGSLAVTGLADAGPVVVATMGHDRALAAALALSGTGGLMVLLRVVHPPAGATTMIISLGFITRPFNLAIVEASIVLLTIEAIAINYAADLAPAKRERGRGRSA
jgi:CBS-domain-containing membrane protein